MLAGEGWGLRVMRHDINCDGEGKRFFCVCMVE